MEKQKISVIIISGPVGVGKTTVSDAISEILSERSIPHAVIDLDNLRYVFPRPLNDPFHSKLGYKNLAAVWKNYQEAGLTRVIIPNVVEELSDKEKIEDAIPGSYITVVRLLAPIETIHKRLKDREKSQKSLDWHLSRATELSSQLEKSGVEDFVIDVDNKTPAEIAKEILSYVD